MPELRTFPDWEVSRVSLIMKDNQTRAAEQHQKICACTRLHSITDKCTAHFRIKTDHTKTEYGETRASPTYASLMNCATRAAVDAARPKATDAATPRERLVAQGGSPSRTSARAADAAARSCSAKREVKMSERTHHLGVHVERWISELVSLFTNYSDEESF